MKSFLLLIAFCFIQASYSQTDTSFTPENVLDGVHIPEHTPRSCRFMPYHSLRQKNIIWPKIDTNFHENGKIWTIGAVDSIFNYIGFYKEYDDQGNLILEGNYSVLDSAKCISISSKGFGSGRKISDRIKVYNFKVNVWKSYFSSGVLCSIGSYDTLFSCTICSIYQEEDRPSPVGLSHEQLKAGIWKYYNEQGELIREEEYHSGNLVSERDY